MPLANTTIDYESHCMEYILSSSSSSKSLGMKPSSCKCMLENQLPLVSLVFHNGGEVATAAKGSVELLCKKITAGN